MKIFATAAAIACAIALPTVFLSVAEAAMVKTFPVTLVANGLIVAGPGGQAPQTARFGMVRAAAIKIVSAGLGAPTKTGVYPECGSGHAIGYAKFRGGIELSFVGGELVGWTLEDGGSQNYRMANGVGIGTNVTTLQRLLPKVFVDPGNEEGGGLGPGFTLDDGPNGWLDGNKPTSKVTSMYSGETCIVE
ncbi:hypothetical protein FPZ24_10405 [Sphingomonas panacisoli]|uniref:Uncharacterized protein n=1 Tax=Sphingomonas panacisoli TaxID=1813879 RepID=A0A5B8LJ62_9SPHN|nr:hypothetical protein [Sphingomonas panacisoli]QDZ07845.1 hypothetical protein FPZ24_10405 [Sphingomonas panacisoli]